MSIQEINNKINDLGEYPIHCAPDCGFQSLKYHHHGHKFWKNREKDIYFYISDQRVFMFQKDFGGNYRLKEIEGVDVRALEAVDAGEFSDTGYSYWMVDVACFS